MTEMQKTLSPFHIFTQVQNYVNSVNTAPLIPDIIKVNKDQLNELGNEEEVELPFARIDTGFAESYDQLLFALDFYEKGVDLGISGGEGAWVTYDDLGDSNKEVATALTNLLTAFSNGQIKILLTCFEDNEHIQAMEIIYKKPRQRVYNAIITRDMFLPARKRNGRELMTTLFANEAAIKDVELDVSKAQRLLLQDVDEDIMNAIGRKDLVDLNEPLTPEILKQNIDAYGELMGQKAAAKIDKKFDEFEVSIGIHGMSMWEQFIHFARWRHIELMLWGFMMLTAQYWVAWNFTTVHPIILMIGISLIPLYIFRSRYPYPQILYIFAPIGYVLYLMGVIVFLQHFTSHWISWTVGIFAVISIAESIFFDIYFIRKKIYEKIYNWAKK